jgi:hypothetical protein
MDTSTLMLLGATAIGSAGASAVASRIWFQRRLAALQQRLDHVELQRALALDRSNQARQQIQQMQDKMAELQHTQRKTVAEEASRPRNAQTQAQPQRASAPAPKVVKPESAFADTVVREPFPDTVLRQTFPNTVVQQTFPNTVVQQPFPNTVVQQPFPDTVVRQPFPDTVVRQPFPDTVVRKPFADTAARQPFPELPAAGKLFSDTVVN